MRPTIGLDATPLVSGHAMRGIGRYLAGLLAAVGEVEHAWAATSLGLLLVRGQLAPLDVRVWRTFRTTIRPQDTDPIIATFADRLAVRRRSPRIWHHTDPTVPSTPLPLDRTIVTAYDLIPLLEPDVMAKIRPHRRMLYRRYLHLLQQARGVIAISATTADDVAARLAIPLDRIHVVPPFVPARSLATSFARPNDRPTFLVVGVPDPHKRIELAIEAFYHVVVSGLDARLVLAGFHPPGARATLLKLAGQLGVAERVRFAGPVDDVELNRLYAETVLIACSRIEGFGLPPVEAILAGGRVAATPTRAYLEAVGNEATFAADHTSSALADAMQAALGTEVEPSKRSALAERFSARSVASALISAYGAAEARL